MSRRAREERESRRELARRRSVISVQAEESWEQGRRLR